MIRQWRTPQPSAVALLAEGVDRNLRVRPLDERQDTVALLAEGVDRNKMIDTTKAVELVVALLAEGVDRNILTYIQYVDGPVSPSSRRAWIEISLPYSLPNFPPSPSSRRAWIEIA